jgi:hypothetical protein
MTSLLQRRYYTLSCRHAHICMLVYVVVVSEHECAAVLMSFCEVAAFSLFGCFCHVYVIDIYFG